MRRAARSGSPTSCASMTIRSGSSSAATAATRHVSTTADDSPDRITSERLACASVLSLDFVGSGVFGGKASEPGTYVTRLEGLAVRRRNAHDEREKELL